MRSETSISIFILNFGTQFHCHCALCDGSYVYFILFIIASNYRQLQKLYEDIFYNCSIYLISMNTPFPFIIWNDPAVVCYKRLQRGERTRFHCHPLQRECFTQDRPHETDINQRLLARQKGSIRRHM